jgi:hypothetical protein
MNDLLEESRNASSTVAKTAYAAVKANKTGNEPSKTPDSNPKGKNQKGNKNPKNQDNKTQKASEKDKGGQNGGKTTKGASKGSKGPDKDKGEANKAAFPVSYDFDSVQYESESESEDELEYESHSACCAESKAKWLYDTGSSDHITNSKACFTSYKPFKKGKEGSLKTGRGTIIPIGKGIVIL